MSMTLPGRGSADSTTLGTEHDAATISIDVSVDNNHCHLFAICEQEAPEVFRLVGERLVYQRSPSADQLDQVRHAARLCPMQAITVSIGIPRVRS